jgi:pyruvate kinase
MRPKPQPRKARTKIVATIGPTSAEPATIDALLDAGMDVARLNCAHGDPESLARMLATLRAAARQKQIPLAILADLAGPKLRVGMFAQGKVELTKGAKFILTTDETEGNAERVSVNHGGFPGDVHEGDDIFLNDGLIHIVVERVRGSDVHTVVEIGGTLSDRKGFSVPGAEVSMPSLTEKDWQDVDLLAGQVDYLSLSFVRSAKDIQLLRAGLASRGHSVPIVAKIEKAQAVERLDAIVESADVLMVARGDLGVECPIEQVPTLQKKIIAACLRAGKPVITATQMLESMVGNPRPTRAEASDVANAVLDGSDALMLSAETAAGRYPVAAVQMMHRIIVQAEDFARERTRPRDVGGERSIGAAVGYSACIAAETVDAALIVCLTRSGATARQLARWRPRQPILAVTTLEATARQLSLVWGVEALCDDTLGQDFDRGCRGILALLRQQRHGLAGEKVVITAGLPFSERGRTNTLRIDEI